MKILFEGWLEKQSFNMDVQRLFNESFICYRAKAYRASMLFSFIAFQKILRHRMLNATLPKSYSDKPSAWDQIKGDLMNEDKVDHKIIDCVNQKSNNNIIFLLSDDVRTQYMYWKDRRNDCAHGKSNVIDVNHVEAFWLFIQSNLSKFQVNGGKEALLNKVKEFLDDNITPRNTSPQYLIEEVPSAIYLGESKNFFGEILEIVDSSEIWRALGILGNKEKSLVIGFFNTTDEYRKNLIELLEDNIRILSALLHEEPTLLQYITNPSIVRQLWKKHLKVYSKNSYEVIIKIFHYNLIPNNQKEEMFGFCLDNYLDYYFREADKLDYINLKNYGFIEHFEKEAFRERKIDNFSWSERNRHLVCFYLKYSETIEVEVLNALDFAFGGYNHPFKLRDELKILFTKNNEVYKKLTDSFKDKWIFRKLYK